MKKIFNLFRFVSWIAIGCSLLGALLLFIVGAVKTYTAYSIIALGQQPEGQFSHLELSEVATTYLIKSLDTFLIALVLFIFAHGVFTLFISDKQYHKTAPVLKWIQTPNIGRLKNILGEVIVIILFVKFLEMILINLNSLTWSMLILPCSILLLALSLKLLGLGRESRAAE